MSLSLAELPLALLTQEYQELIVTFVLVTMLAFFWFGGLDAWQHYCLRALLWGTGCTPWRYVAFLDAAVERLLLEYFAGQPDSEGTEARM